jgi:molecular chaperone GrpE
MTSEPKADESKPVFTGPAEQPAPQAAHAAGTNATAAASAQSTSSSSAAGSGDADQTAHAKSYVDPTIAMEAAIAGLEANVKDLTDRLLRTHAEMDNMRKRTERDKADTVKYAITKFAGDIVTVGDNFQRAIMAVPAGAADADPALKSLVEGVTLTERTFLNVLENHGVKRLDPKGQAFDPNFHQAVMEQPDTTVPSGTVLQVFQAGFVIEDRILRPAMVVVSTGGFKPMKPVAVKQKPEPEDDPDDDFSDEVPELR